MSEMIERVARALAAQAHDPDSEYWLPYARAAIEAMREPTDAMKEAADMDRTYYGHVASNHWRAMISAALSPAQPVKEK